MPSLLFLFLLYNISSHKAYVSLCQFPSDRLRLERPHVGEEENTRKGRKRAKRKRKEKL